MCAHVGKWNSASLASLTRETGPKVVRGDPARKSEGAAVAHVAHQHHHLITPTISVSDSSLKFTHVLYNLSPAGIYIHTYIFIHIYNCTQNIIFGCVGRCLYSRYFLVKDIWVSNYNSFFLWKRLSKVVKKSKVTYYILE